MSNILIPKIPLDLNINKLWIAKDHTIKQAVRGRDALALTYNENNQPQQFIDIRKFYFYF